MKRLLQERTFTTTNFFAITLLFSAITATWTVTRYLDKFLAKQDKVYSVVIDIAHKDTIQDLAIETNSDSIRAISYRQSVNEKQINEIILALNELMPANRKIAYYTEKHTARGLQFNSIKP